jgi:hypothetical protein
MTDDELIRSVRARALNPSTCTDYTLAPQTLPEPASEETIELVERSLMFPLHRIHRRMLVEIANGGFGPGAGLVGVMGGHHADESLCMLELREQLMGGFALPPGSIPLCEWGCGIWTLYDASRDDAPVLTLNESGLAAMGMGLRDWLRAWAEGRRLWDEMFEFAERTGINPFTRQTMVYRFPLRPRGQVYRHK